VFVRYFLGPALKSSQLETKIIIYDHNADRIDYPINILSDPLAAKYVTGSAFHLYAGEMSDLSKVHKRFPEKGIYFTEQWVEAPENDKQFGENLLWAVEGLLINGTQNWCKCVLQWNLAIGPNWGPHTPGGCSDCLGAVTIINETITRNSGYYTIAHASKFVPEGSIKIETTNYLTFPNTAFLRPDGRIVILLSNNNNQPTPIIIKIQKNVTLKSTLPSKSVVTYIWPSTTI